MYKKFLTELKHSIKERGFIEGKDYIGIDTEKYFILIPFIFEILQPFNKYDGKVPILAHCLTHNKKYFRMYYEQQFLKLNRLKCFFFNKSEKIANMQFYNNHDDVRETRIATLCEFTCWLDENDDKTHLFHNFYNNFNSCDSDCEIYSEASLIIKNLKPTIFEEVKRYDINKIRKQIIAYLKKK